MTQESQLNLIHASPVYPTWANQALERTAYMLHGSCSELQLPRRIPAVAQFGQPASEPQVFQNRSYGFKKGFTTVTLPYCWP